MTNANSGRRGGLLASAAVGLLLLAGCSTGNVETSDGTTAPPAAAAPSQGPGSAVPTPAGSPAAAAAAKLPPVLPGSAPVALAFPAIGVVTALLSLGLRENNSLKVPPDGPGAPASWYSGSPTPGERGPAVLLGHVNAVGGGPGVFAGLRSLNPGTPITVRRADGSNATFTVDRAAAYSKDNFPTVEVYGNTSGAELRLITCDGYDPATGLFNDNYVIYAKLTA
jgi:hypothetical protein